MGIKLVQGHRGSSEVYPESTMLSYRKAVEEGAGAIEMDLRVSSDGLHYILHDSTLDRTTNGTGTYNTVTWDYVRTLDAGAWKGQQFANREDTKVPSFEQILDEFQGTGVYFVLHLKSWIAAALDVLSIVKSRGMLEQCIFFGDLAVINPVKKAEPNAFTQNDGQPTEAEYLTVLQDVITNHHNVMSIDAVSCTKEMVDTIKSSGILVHCSALGSNYEYNMQRLLGFGVDFVLGNNVSAMVHAYGNYKQRNYKFRNNYKWRNNFKWLQH